MSKEKKCATCGKEVKMSWLKRIANWGVQEVFCDYYCARAYSYFKSEQYAKRRAKNMKEIAKRYNILMRRLGK